MHYIGLEARRALQDMAYRRALDFEGIYFEPEIWRELVENNKRGVWDAHIRE